MKGILAESFGPGDLEGNRQSGHLIVQKTFITRL